MVTDEGCERVGLRALGAAVVDKGALGVLRSDMPCRKADKIGIRGGIVGDGKRLLLLLRSGDV